jgi:hypothetical protein
MSYQATKAVSYNYDQTTEIYSKLDSDCSFITYDTVDIQEERADNSRKAKLYLLAFVFANILLNLWMLYIYL